MATKPKQVIAMSAPVTITAGEAEGEGAKKSPPKFNVLAYTGGILEGALRGDDGGQDVILDLAGMQSGKSLVANLDHTPSQRVGNVNAIGNDGKQLNLAGIASAATPARDEVVGSAADGFVWQASIEANPTRLEAVKPGGVVEVNGQSFTAPPRGGRALYVARTSVLKGFAFVSHGADDNTAVSIAASAANPKERVMDAKIKAWAEEMGLDVDSATPEQQATIEANYAGKNGKPAKTIEASNPFEARKIEAKRRREIREIADRHCELRNSDEEEIMAIEKMHDHAIEAQMTVQEFRLELYESSVPPAGPIIHRPRERQLSTRIVEAAICQTLRLPNIEKSGFDDQTLQAAHDRFRDGIGLRQLILLAAEGNGYRSNHSSEYNRSVLQAAFDKPRQIKAQGWSTIDISTIVSNIANKFLREGFMAVEDTWSRISTIRPVRDFKQITTVSLVGDLNFEQLGPAGEIKHGTLGEVTYNNQANTYAKMLAITRQDIINDDMGALAAAPRRLGRGAGTKLNDIFWTAWLGGEGAGFWSATHTDVGNTGNSNLNSGAADVTIAGLTATELLFLNQVDPNGLPLGIMPKIILVPNALKASMAALLDPQSRLITGASATLSDVNIFAGRFQLESSSYMGNSAYTGFSAQEWYMIADPNELSTIEVVALNGRVEPTVETADADFNTLGIQMRAYGDVGVSLQEFRASVLADGNSS
jgi:hypothetical protein